MKLIEYINYEIKISDEALLVKPIRDLYKADKSKTKENFYSQCSVIFFMVDPRSTYNYITNPKERLEIIKQQEGLPKDFKIDDKLNEAMEWYKKHTFTTSTLLLEDARIAVDKVRKFLRDVDLNAIDEKTGKPIYTVNTITAAIKQLPQLAKDLKETEKALAMELEDLGKARGGNDSKSLMDDGIL